MIAVNPCCQWRHPKFEYLEAGTVAEACSMLSQYKEKAMLIAGGTEVLVMARRGKISPEYVINIKNIPDLNYIKYLEDGLHIGALATLNDLERSPIIRERFPVIAYAAGQVGSQQVRNTGTLGGNICNAAPFGDMAPCLIGLGARVKLHGVNEERMVSLEEFFKGPGKSVLQEGEMLLEVHVPDLSPDTQAIYRKFPARTAIDIAAASAAVVIQWRPKDRLVSDARIVLGAVAPTPVRAYYAEDILRGNIMDEPMIEKAAKTAVEDIRPITDIRASEGYRREMVKVLVAQGLRELISSVN